MQKYIDIIFEIFIQNPTGQFVGLIAFIFSFYTFLFCSDKKFIIFMAIISFLWGLHFSLIGLLSACLIQFIDLFKNILALKYEKSIKISLIFILFYILAGFIAFDGYISLIPILTALVSTYLVFYIRGIWLNIGFIGIIILWGIYNFLGQSIGGLATDITLFFTGTIGVFRIIISEKKDCKKIEKFI